jgi:hypothetical protein
MFGRSAINAEYRDQSAAEILKNGILSNEPLMVSRFGANELNFVLNYHFISGSIIQNVKNLIIGIPFCFKMKSGILKNMHEVAGFFPITSENIMKFYELTMNDLKEIDVLGSWLNHEKFLFESMSRSLITVRLRDLTPLTCPESPWTSALEGKKVLVIHPFEQTIKNQFRKRALLFENGNMLPDFELKTIKAVQSIAGHGTGTGFNDWFDALDYMKLEIEKTDFDIAIIGCGSYGMPLAAHIKRLGKQAFHLGGETQILFGIKGKRWEGPTYKYDSLFYNENWVRPLSVDTPENIWKVEEGCYW